MLHLTVIALYIPCFIHQTLHSILYTLDSTLGILHSAVRSLYTWHSHFDLYAFALYTLHFTLSPATLPFSNLKLYGTWPSSIVVLRVHIDLSSCTFAAHCVTFSPSSTGPLRCTFEFSPALCTLHSAFYTPHFTL